LTKTVQHVVVTSSIFDFLGSAGGEKAGGTRERSKPKKREIDGTQGDEVNESFSQLGEEYNRRLYGVEGRIKGRWGEDGKERSYRGSKKLPK